MRDVCQSTVVVVGIACLALSCAAVKQDLAQPVADQHKTESWCAASKSNATEKKFGFQGSLVDVSELFREAAQRAKQRECRVLEDRGLLIRYFFGNVEARFNGTSFGPPHSVYTPEVHVLKAVSHSVQLVALLVGEPPTERKVHAEKAMRDCERLRGDLGDPSSQPRHLLSDEQAARQLGILEAVINVLHDMKAQEFREGAYAEFFATVRTPLKENLRDASKAVLLDLHKTVAGYRARAEQQDPAAWSSVRVVAAVGHQSREQEVGAQYFSRLLGERITAGARGEDRLVVAEGIFDPPQQRGLVSAHVVDQQASELVFGDPVRLQWDVLADDFGVIDELIPKH